MPPTRESLVRFFKTKGRRPVTFRDIVDGMGLDSPGSRAIKKILRAMVDAGEAVRTKRGMYGLMSAPARLTGHYESHRDGYGFVIPDGVGQKDIFIPPRKSMFALDNDRVEVEIEDEAKRVGRVINVLDRARHRLLGTVEIYRGNCFFRPGERTVGFDVHIPEHGELRNGQRVMVEVTRFPDGARPAVGKVVRVLDAGRSPAEDVEIIIEEHALPVAFPQPVHKAASALVPAADTGRRDLRHLRTVTIDGERARDYDDAVSITRDADGYVLSVHIADVGHYVKWGDPIDSEARMRGTSVYFPDRVLPMLPERLSEDLCSLVPEQDRPAMTVEMRFDRRGAMERSTYYSSVIRSDARMTYTSVRKILIDLDPEERRKYSALIGDFEAMQELAHLIRDRRFARGSLDFDLPEAEIVLDMRGMPEAVLTAERNFAHMIIEEFMVAANEAVASFLEAKGLPCLYRIHEEPEPRRIEEVVRIAKLYAGIGLRRGSADLHHLLRLVKGVDGEDVISHMALRAMKLARYSEYNVGHYGLASKSYCHFTSPIRRYPDLMVHRALRAAVESAGDFKQWERELAGIAAHSSKMERVAMEAERDVVDSMKAWFMSGRLGEEFEAKVAGAGPYGLRVRLRDWHIDGTLDMIALKDDYYVYDERRMLLHGNKRGREYRLGQALRVRVDRVDLVDRRIAFGLARG